MSNFLIEATIEEQLANFDREVVSKNQYLYLYTRPAARSTYWHIMVRNVCFLPSFDRELNRTINQQLAELLLQNMSVIIGCEYKIINSFGYDSTQKIIHELPETERLQQHIELDVIEHKKKFYAVIRNTTSGMIYPIGLARSKIEEAQADIRFNKVFYNKPQKILQSTSV